MHNKNRIFVENERASFKFEVATAKTHTPVSNRAYEERWWWWW